MLHDIIIKYSNVVPNLILSTEYVKTKWLKSKDGGEIFQKLSRSIGEMVCAQLFLVKEDFQTNSEDELVFDAVLYALDYDITIHLNIRKTDENYYNSFSKLFNARYQIHKEIKTDGESGELMPRSITTIFYYLIMINPFLVDVNYRSAIIELEDDVRIYKVKNKLFFLFESFAKEFREVWLNDK